MSESRARQYFLVRLVAVGGGRDAGLPVRRQEPLLDVFDGLLPGRRRPNEATVVGDHETAVVVDHAIESCQDLLAVHPVERTAHGYQIEVSELTRQVFVDRDGCAEDSAAGDAGTCVHACSRVHATIGAGVHASGRGARAGPGTCSSPGACSGN